MLKFQIRILISQFLFPVLVLFIPFHVLAQRNVLRIDGNVKDEKNKLEGVSITVYKYNQFFAKAVTESGGKFRFQLNYDSEYMLEFSKPGYISKKVNVNTDSVPLEDQDFGHEYGGWDLSLFRVEEYMDVSVFDKPYVKISYNQYLRKFTHDVEYTQLVKTEFEQAIKDFDKKKKEEEKKKKEEKKAALAEAVAEKAKIEAEAKRRAEEESSAKKDEERKKKEAAKLAQATIEEEQRKKAVEAKVEKSETEEQYKKLIKIADNSLKNKEYESAKRNYEQAQKLNPKENYPQQKIQEINYTLNSAAISVNKARRDTQEYKTKEEFFQALAKLYPRGVTEETYMEGNVKVIRRIVVDGNLGAEYKFTEHPWGGRFWFKNGTPINESIWNVETQVKK